MMLLCGKGISQTDTKNKVVIDTSLARKIAIDLVKGDECKEELKLVYKNVSLLEKKVSVKDSIVSTQKNQIVNLNKMVEGKDKLLKISDESLSITKKELSKSKRNTFFYKLSTLISVSALAFYIVQ